MPNPTLKMDSVTVLDKDPDGVHFKNSLIHSSTTFPAGHVIQVVQATNSTSDTNASASVVDWFSASISLSSSSNKVLINATAALNHNDSYTGYWGLKRGSTVIWPEVDNTGGQAVTVRGASLRIGGDSHGDQFETPIHHVTYLDSPSTQGTVTYYIFHAQRGGTMYRNRSKAGTGDGDNASKATSILLLQEIAG